MGWDGLPAKLLERLRRQRLLEADRQEATAELNIRAFLKAAAGPVDGPPEAIHTVMAGMTKTHPDREEAILEALLPRPCSPADIDWAAEALGFPLPAILQQLYLEVGNGAFGPGNGVFTIERLVAEYQDLVDRTVPPIEALWPGPLLPVADLDPGFVCLDVESGRVLEWTPDRFEEEEEEEEDWEAEDGSFSEAAPNLSQWLEEWLDGDD